MSLRMIQNYLRISYKIEMEYELQLIDLIH